MSLDRNGDGNGDGIINDGGELFGQATMLSDGSKAADGFAAPRALDDNGDGQLSSADAAFGTLRVWVDANSDGASQLEELRTLGSLHIASIATTAQTVSQLDKGLVCRGKPITQRSGAQAGVAGVYARSITPAAPGFLALPTKNA